jgi:arsenical pump membrane protein
MTHVAAFSILLVTVTLSLSRPRIGPLHIHHSWAAVFGAFLALALGVVPVPMVRVAAELLFFPILTIVSLMIITLVAESAGIFQAIAVKISHAAGGSGRRLFAYLFCAGTITGTVFTNDAAVLIFTPLVFELIEQVSDESWSTSNKIPFYFAVLYVANLVGAFVISNPINIVVSSLFDIQFGQYAAWMMLPALASILVSFVALALVFRRAIPARYHPERIQAPGGDTAFRRVTIVILLLTLAALLFQQVIRVPTWVVASAGAATLMMLSTRHRQQTPREILAGVGWDVLIFVFGIFIVAMGLRNAGMTHAIGSLLTVLGGESLVLLSVATAFVSAVSSSIMNNHPTVDMMSWVIRDLTLSAPETRHLALSALIGGDLGPKMLPIGSLAALLWFRILRSKGVDIPFSLYIFIGIPLTIVAVALSVFVLNAEYALVQWLD